MRKEIATSKEILKKELDNLKKKCGISTSFEVLWTPKTDSTQEGDLRGSQCNIPKPVLEFLENPDRLKFVITGKTVRVKPLYE